MEGALPFGVPPSVQVPFHRHLGAGTTPSCVAFTDAERLVGDAVKDQAARDYSENTLFDAERFVAREFADPTVQADVTLWPFRKVIPGQRDESILPVNFRGEERKLRPEEISSMVLLEMKGTAEAYLSTKVDDAVVTVPAYSRRAGEARRTLA